MPLDLLDVSTQVRQMGELLAARRADQHRRLSLLEEVLAAYRDRWQELAELAERVRERVAVPTGPLDEVVPAPVLGLKAYTALATDGAEIDPDRHGGAGDFFLINVGRVAIPYGQPGRPVELASATRLGYTDEDLYIVDPRDARRQVPMRDRHLDALRTVEELRALADLAEQQQGEAPAVALVDGTLLFSVLEERPRDFLRARFYSEYVQQLERLRHAGVAVAAYASRSRGVDLVNLFRAAFSPEHAAALRGLSDAHILGRALGRKWERSGLFRVRSNVHDPYFGLHRVYFFLLQTGDEIARVEMPEWVAASNEHRTNLHAVLVDQCQKGFGYPAVLARADDRAVISLSDRNVLDTLVRQELARRGVLAKPSAKLHRKQVRTV
ncbi:MAG TPA: DNA double-strand break repair nuclease NurA [Chloroflexota bacterium]|nr:DNA double-strand break repair nuclease NurA [Chloroflexota bacterium]